MARGQRRRRECAFARPAGARSAINGLRRHQSPQTAGIRRGIAFIRWNRSPPNVGAVECATPNHSFSCDCGFGGDTGGGGRCWGSVANFTANYVPQSFGWARDNGGTVESYVNPNARCPVCRCPAYFYRSPYNGRVFFDDIGWPWPKHGCTDNRRERERTIRDALAAMQRPEPRWRDDGWSALLSARISHGVERSGVRGDWGGRLSAIRWTMRSTSPFVSRRRARND